MSENPPVLLGSNEDAEQAWREVFESCQDGLRVFLASRLGQEADVDDCLQSVVVQMIRQARRTDSQVASFARRAWLFRVAANEAARMWRSKAATGRMLEHQGLRSQANESVACDTTEKMMLAESTLRLREALEQLPDSYRVIIRLRIDQEKTFQQIADELQIPLGTALTRMRRALERIRALMQDADE